MNFLEKISSSKDGNLYKVQDLDAQGRSIWFIVRVAKLKLPIFLKIKHGQKYNIKDYGDIINWGYGVPAEKNTE